MSKRTIIFISVVLALAMMFSLAGCGAGGGENTPSAPAQSGSATTSTPKPDGDGSSKPAVERSKIVNVGQTERIRSIDPHQRQDMGTDYGLAYMYDMLITPKRSIEGDGTGSTEIVGQLAESWEIDPDNMFWTFKLREDVYFHNGQHFTADDVVCTFERLIEQKDVLQTAITDWPLLAYVEKIDDYKVKVGFSEPFPWASASFRATYIIPHEAYEEMGDDLWNKQIACGTGPWILVEWLDGQYIHFKKNPNYWNKENYDPYFEEVYHRFISEPTTGVSAMLSGDLDVFHSPSGIDRMMLPQFAGTEDRIELIDRKTTYMYYIQFRCNPNNVFSDINVRKAFELAIDRQAIVDGIFSGDGAYISTTGFFTQGVDGNNEGMIHTYDPDEAKRLLQGSAYNGKLSRLLAPRVFRKRRIAVWLLPTWRTQ